jgi:Oxidoreductase family, NAD-binding Rossmann fold
MPETRIWTVAVVGCGIGRSHIAEGYARHPDKFQVHTLCDIDEGRLTALGDEFSVPRRTRSFDELLRMGDVDIVDICTPPVLHCTQTLAALAAGKQVVCGCRSPSPTLAARSSSSPRSTIRRRPVRSSPCRSNATIRSTMVGRNTGDNEVPEPGHQI